MSQVNTRQQWAVPIIRVLYALFYVCIFALVMRFIPKVLAWFDPTLQDPIGLVFDWIIRTDILAETGNALPRIRTFLITHAVASSALVGLIYGFLRKKKQSQARYERFFAPFDTALFSPIQSVRAFDPLRPVINVDEQAQPMPWMVPEDGHRQALWNRLKEFSQGRDKLDYILVLGRPGSGKSRMAVEFVREVLAKAPVFELTPNPASWVEKRWHRTTMAAAAVVVARAGQTLPVRG